MVNGGALHLGTVTAFVYLAACCCADVLLNPLALPDVAAVAPHAQHLAGVRIGLRHRAAAEMPLGFVDVLENYL